MNYLDFGLASCTDRTSVVDCLGLSAEFTYFTRLIILYMAIIKSAKRNIRSSARKAVYNARRNKAMKEVVKEIKILTVAKDKKTAEATLAKAYKAIDKAAKGNTIKKNTASRKKSRLAKMIKKLG